ncbi:thioredoxin family protein [Gymnodinialimonas sp. 2305UL16-5]|uniref:thioredoxin family protein n=1 Tax=Gymnodinialimonas mytili TaxID=3126503 RepID=UPI0030966D59
MSSLRLSIFWDFASDWCSTCQSQYRMIGALLDENLACREAITFYRVDWDGYGRSDLRSQLWIPHRSTLVVFRNGEEVARIVVGTREADNRTLLDAGL